MFSYLLLYIANFVYLKTKTIFFIDIFGFDNLYH